VVADDFGDQLDAASGEYLAARLRRRAGQVWLTSRRSEVTQTFQPEELVRLTCRSGQREQYQLAITSDKKARVRRRQLNHLLASAMSASTVVLLEGPHDLEAYKAVAQRLHIEERITPPSAYGMRLVAASAASGEGGKEALPRLAQLATELGFAVRVVLDHDKPGGDVDLIDELSKFAEMIVRLPERAAVERALIDGLAVDDLRSTLQILNDAHELRIDLGTVTDDGLADKCVWALKQKNGLHQFFVEALPSGVFPPLARTVLKELKKEIPAVPLVELEDV
jgi:putative ATP-dependent endonuclease of the OLD family